MPQAVRIALFAIAASLACVVYAFLFAFRYFMFVKVEEIVATGIGMFFAVPLVLVAALWMFFPSRLLVAAVCLAGLLSPPLAYRDQFIPIDATFLGFALVTTALFVGATQLRRGLRRPPEGKAVASVEASHGD